MNTDAISDAHLAPIACTLDTVAYRDRVVAWEALSKRARLSGVRTVGGVELRYRRDPEVDQALEDLVELERVCCPFLDFELAAGVDEILLRIAAPADAGPLLEEFLRLGSSPPRA